MHNSSIAHLLQRFLSTFTTTCILRHLFFRCQGTIEKEICFLKFYDKGFALDKSFPLFLNSYSSQRWLWQVCCYGSHMVRGMGTILGPRNKQEFSRKKLHSAHKISAWQWIWGMVLVWPSDGVWLGGLRSRSIPVPSGSLQMAGLIPPFFWWIWLLAEGSQHQNALLVWYKFCMQEKITLDQMSLMAGLCPAAAVPPAGLGGTKWGCVTQK